MKKRVKRNKKSQFFPPVLSPVDTVGVLLKLLSPCLSAPELCMLFWDCDGKRTVPLAMVLPSPQEKQELPKSLYFPLEWLQEDN